LEGYKSIYALSSYFYALTETCNSNQCFNLSGSRAF